jgi:hypothetical protein
MDIMENLELYLSLAATILGLIISTITFLTKFIKSKKGKKIAEELLKISLDLMPLIEEAEKFVNYTGAEKKAYVMTRATQFVINKGMNVTENNISNKIEELVNLTNEVNVRKHRNNVSTNSALENNNSSTYNPNNELHKLNG